MGQTQSKYTVCSPAQIDQLQSEGSIGYCEVVRNRRTGQPFQKYKLINQNIKIDEELQFYEFRKNQNTNLIRTVFVQDIKSFNICNSKKYYNIYCERIPLRLSDVQNITLEEGLMIVKHVLTALDSIKDSYEEVIKLNSEMIGFTVEGKVKFWVNQNIYLNYPEEHLIVKNVPSQNAFSCMILQVFNILQKHIKNKVFPVSLRSKLENVKQNFNYQKAKTLIRNYSIQNNLILPETLNFHQYISKFKKQTLKLETISTLNPKKPIPRTIKIIPQIFKISQNLASSNVLFQRDNNKIDQNHTIYDSKQQRILKSIRNQNSISSESFYNEAINIQSKQIQRIRSEYILESLVVNKASMDPISWQLDRSVKLSEFNQQNREMSYQYTYRQTDSLNDRIDQLRINVQNEIERSQKALNLNFKSNHTKTS